MFPEHLRCEKKKKSSLRLINLTTYLKKKKSFYYLFWPCPAACGISVPRPGIEPAHLHWSAVLTTGPPRMPHYLLFMWLVLNREKKGLTSHARGKNTEPQQACVHPWQSGKGPVSCGPRTKLTLQVQQLHCFNRGVKLVPEKSYLLSVVFFF